MKIILLRCAVGGTLVLFTLACVGEVEGERAASGECPEGEICSEDTPAGLKFIGEVLYDEGVQRLGPVLVNGTFDLGLDTVDGGSLPAFDLEIDDPDVLRGTTGGAGELVSGYPVQGQIHLEGGHVGTTMVRVVHPETGELFDRLPLDVYELSRVELVNAHDSGRGYVYEGCTEALGVHIIGANGSGSEVRVFDQTLDVTGDFISRPDPGMWDCFLVDVPVDGGSLGVEAHLGGLVHGLSMPVRTLKSDGLTACPG